MATDQVIDHSGCVPAGIHTVDAHTHEGQTGYWLFRSEAVSRGTLKHSVPFVQATGVPPCPAGELYTSVVYSKGAGPYGEHNGQRCQHGQPAPEVPFPVITSQSHTVSLQFTDPQDRDLFKRWITRGGGWAAFGTYVDERRG